MGPRSDGRGQRVVEDHVAGILTLQWGRDLTVADSYVSTPDEDSL